MSPSLAKTLAEETIAGIVEALDLKETHRSELLSDVDASVVGFHRVLTGDAVELVNVGMTVEAFKLDSHMIFAFTRPESAVPHFTLDSVLAGDHYAFHLDLIPRVDPGANLAYLNHSYLPLTEAYSAVADIEGLTPAHLSPRQWQLMSSWMLAHRADESGFSAIGPTVAVYRDHWIGLVRGGIPAEALEGIGPDYLDARDRRNRAAIFSPEVDPVWAQVDRLLGSQVSEGLRESLRTAARGGRSGAQTSASKKSPVVPKEV